MKAPHAQFFVRDVMRRLGCETVRDLAKSVGWTGDRERKLYKWEAGEQSPNMQGTIALLMAAGLLREKPLPSLRDQGIELVLERAADLEEQLRRAKSSLPKAAARSSRRGG